MVLKYICLRLMYQLISLKNIQDTNLYPKVKSVLIPEIVATLIIPPPHNIF